MNDSSRAQFPILHQTVKGRPLIYLDNAATTPLDKEVIKEMCKVMENQFGNPSSIHAHGREVRSVVEKARKTIANLINTSPAEIFFTSGGTEADNTAIRCGILYHGITHAITSKIEHHAVLHTLEALAQEGIIKLSFVNINEKGSIDLAHLEELLKTHPKTLVSLMHANNEIGTLTNIEHVGELCEQYNAIFHSDTVQTVGHFPFDLKNTPVHFITGAGHKLHGPKGVGILYIHESIKINPMVHGGAQERNMRAGTENLYGIVGFSKALEIATEQFEKDSVYIDELKRYMMDSLLQNIEGVTFNGDPLGKYLYAVLSVNFPASSKSEMLLFNLDINHICASGGSACSSGANAGSHVIRAINNNPDITTVRFSFSKHNTKYEIDVVVAKLKEII